MEAEAAFRAWCKARMTGRWLGHKTGSNAPKRTFQTSGEVFRGGRTGRKGGP